MERRLLLLTEEQGHGGVHTLLGLLQQTLTEQGWHVEALPVRQDRPGFLQLLARARQARVLVASNNFSPAYWAVLLGLLAHRPTVVWVHGPLTEVLGQRPVSWFRRQLLRWTVHLADLLVFASRTSQASLHQVMPPGSLPLQAVVGNPAPACSEATQVAPPTAGVALGFVGRLSAEKRPGLLLDMLQHLPADHHLTFVGDGPLRSGLEQQATRLGLLGGRGQAARVHFAGAQPVSPRTYHAWQATLLCSAYEGYPMAALESLAAGVPCIATPLPALQEMFGPQAAQWLAPQDTPQSLASTLTRALQTPAPQRRKAAHAVAQRHPRQDFARQWHTQLLRCMRQAHTGAKDIHFVHTGPAYMPELLAYEAYLGRLGHRTHRHSDPASVPLDADIVWWLCGRVSAHHSHRLRRSLHVHEYASASVGRWPGLKDLIKHWLHPLPDHRIFLNEWVRQRMGFDDGVPCSLRDMGVPADFLQISASQPPDHDLVYLGEMGRLRDFMPVLQAISQAGLRLLLIGEVPVDLQAAWRALPGLTFAGRLPQAQVPAQLLRARVGLNLMPERLPLTQQTSTKVLEYLAVGLPVLSNSYPWMAQMHARYPERIHLLGEPATAQAWTAALQKVPGVQTDRSALQHLAWHQRLSGLPVWQQLGLTEVQP
ncbi:MAG: glycosyltransferase [Limnohabitans sp.]